MGTLGGLGLPVALLFAMVSFAPGSAPAQTRTPSMYSVRAQHTATLMNDGRVLLAGGDCLPEWKDGCGGSAEIYDPSAGTFTRTGSMSVGRYDHAAALLPDGRVLIVGGVASPGRPVVEVEVYDPQTGLFSVNGGLPAACPRCFVTPLEDGRIGIGGRDSAGIYDPRDGSMTRIGAGIPDGARPVLLPDRRIYFVGGTSGWSGIYDLDSGSFRRIDAVARYSGRDDSVVQLLDGSVLVSGGDAASGGVNLATWYRISGGDPRPAAGLPGMRTARAGHTSTLLPDGTALLYGGDAYNDWQDYPTERFDPVSRSFWNEFGGALRSFHTATLLPDGNVLIAGGCFVMLSPGYSRQCGAAAFIYTLPNPVPAPRIYTVPGRSAAQGAVLHAGSARVVTETDPAEVGELLEVYVSALAGNGRLAPRVAIGGVPAEVRYFGAAPGFQDLFQVNVRVPEGVAPGASVSVRMNYLARPSNEVTIGLR